MAKCCMSHSHIVSRADALAELVFLTGQVCISAAAADPLRAPATRSRRLPKNAQVIAWQLRKLLLLKVGPAKQQTLHMLKLRVAQHRNSLQHHRHWHRQQEHNQVRGQSSCSMIQ